MIRGINDPPRSVPPGASLENAFKHFCRYGFVCEALKTWAKDELLNGSRIKASRINKVAMRIADRNGVQ